MRAVIIFLIAAQTAFAFKTSQSAFPLKITNVFARISPSYSNDCLSSRRNFLQTSVLVTSLVPLHPALAVPLVYKKEEALQGKIYEKERLRKIMGRLGTYRKALPALDKYMTGLEFDKVRAIEPLRVALREGEFSRIRINGREILSLIEAQGAEESLVTACGAFDRVVAAVEGIDAAALRVERNQGATVEEVGEELRKLEAPIREFIEVAEGVVTVAQQQAAAQREAAAQRQAELAETPGPTN